LDTELLDFLRASTVGRDQRVRTPFGERLIHYFDWTASGRGLSFIESYLQRTALSEYANTHTEDDATGRATSLRLHAAERILKEAVHAGEYYRIVHCGSGTTEAIHRLMQILGIYVPPALMERRREELFRSPDVPVVFIGPYEHHSNVIPWREGLCHLVEIPEDAEGAVDLGVLDAALADPRHAGRQKIGCFSAASNVTGMKTDVRAVARLLHRHDAIACFDWAAAAPYDPIDVRGEDGSWSDAILYSPHKFLGGPGSSGVLIFHRRLYNPDLPPSFGGGGTVGYVGPNDHDFLPDIEEREKPGTPGILQVMRAALAVQVKERLGSALIGELEFRHLCRVMDRWLEDPRIELLGNPDPARRIGIVAFNVRSRDRYLHPRFVTRLLCDLFGIQTRAGCSCAGPYGHRLLGIDEPTSERYRGAVGRGCQAIKPGWVRVNVHYTMSDEEIEYLLDGVDFVAEHGSRFLSRYELRLDTGAWVPRGWEDPPVRFGIDHALEGDLAPPGEVLTRQDRERLRAQALSDARQAAERLSAEERWVHLPGELESISTFHARHVILEDGTCHGLAGDPGDTDH